MEEFEALVGPPSSVLHKGNTTVLVYPNRGRAEFVDGKAVFIKGIKVLDTVEGQGAAQAAGAKPQPQPKAPVLSPQEQEEMEEYGRVLTKEERAQVAVAQAAEAERLKRQEEFLNNGGAPKPPVEPEPAANPWLLMLLQAVFTVPITAVVLKYSFTWCDVDSEWKQMWLPAAADTFVRTAVQAGAQAAWGMTMLFHVDDFLAFFALLFVLIKTTHACTLQRAVAVTMIAKVASVVVWAILSVFILGVMFGSSVKH